MHDEQPSEIVVKSWARLVRAANQALSAIEADLKRAGHPPLTWYDVLLELRRAGEEGLRPFELERELLLAQHNVSRLIDRLEDKGLVQRRPADDDGRGQRVTITGQGQATLASMWPDYAAAIQRHVGAKFANEAEAKTLFRLTGKILDRNQRF
jgi:DNA-binding MarR family transcriptional regulator